MKWNFAKTLRFFEILSFCETFARNLNEFKMKSYHDQLQQFTSRKKPGIKYQGNFLGKTRERI